MALHALFGNSTMALPALFGNNGTNVKNKKKKGALASAQRNIQKDTRNRMTNLIPQMPTNSPLGLPLFDGEGGLVSDLSGEGFLPMTQMFPFYKPQFAMNLGYS